MAVMSDLIPFSKDQASPPAGICERCIDRPRDLGGHEGLYHLEGSEIVPPPGTSLFRCAYCRSIWARGYAGGGQFDWLPAQVGGSVSPDDG